MIDPADAPRIVDYWDINEKTSAEVPFRLATSPSRGFLNSSFAETAGSKKRQPVPTVKMRTDDAAALGVAGGDKVELGNHRGSVELTVEIFDGMQRGVLIAEGIHPNSAHAGGRGINTLIGSDQVPPFGGVAFHDAAVWVRKAAQAA